MSAPTVAILSQSDRTKEITNPLDTTDITYAVDPPNPWEYDALTIETPDRQMTKYALRGKLADTTVIFRMRGDPYWGIHHWYDHPLWPVRKAKQYVALKQLGWVDSCAALAPHQADTYREHTDVPTRLVPLSRDVSDWPTTTHTRETIEALTFTNCSYPTKMAPLYEYADTVNGVLADVGGHWHIGGKGRYSDELADAMADYQHITFHGYVDAREYLQRCNLMLHLSDFDAFAGAILEGFASHLPVVTTEHPAFENPETPNDAIDSATELRQTLQRYTDPRNRQSRGDAGAASVAAHYSHEQVGQEWRQFIEWAIDSDSESTHKCPSCDATESAPDVDHSLRCPDCGHAMLPPEMIP